MLWFLPVSGGNTDDLQCPFDGPWVKAVNHLPAVIKHDQRYNIAVKMVMPFTVELVALLNVS
jgi:hypothetical protein